MKKAWAIMICFILVAAAAAGVIFKVWHDRFRYNESYVNGNTGGNLYNGGLFCESSGTVFFSNPDDNNRLYSMDLTGGNLKKLSDDIAMYINADSNYVYYVRRNKEASIEGAFSVFTFHNNSLCRIPRNGGSVTILDPDPCIYATLIGNYIYYLHYDNETATRLYKIGIDGKGKKELSSRYMFTCSTLGQYFYYNDMDTNGSLCEYDTASDRSRVIYDCNCYKPIVTGDNNVYYLDVNRDNALVHVNIQFGNPVTLSTDSIDLYNVYGSTIFYQRYRKDGSSLCMIKNDGSGFRELAGGNYSNIHVTSYYIYFTDFKTGQVFYTPTANPGEIFSFHPGVIATKKK